MNVSALEQVEHPAHYGGEDDPYEVSQAIPPAYCEHIGFYLHAAVRARGVAA